MDGLSGEEARGLVGDRIAGRTPRDATLLFCGRESGDGAWDERSELLDACFPNEGGGEGEEGEVEVGDEGEGEEVGAAIVDMERAAFEVGGTLAGRLPASWLYNRVKFRPCAVASNLTCAQGAEKSRQPLY